MKTTIGELENSSLSELEIEFLEEKPVQGTAV